MKNDWGGPVQLELHRGPRRRIGWRARSVPKIKQPFDFLKPEKMARW